MTDAIDLARPGAYVGARVAALRVERDLTQTQLADVLTISVYGLARIEAGNRPDLPVSILLRLAAALGVPPATLLPQPMPPAAEVAQAHQEKGRP